MKYAKTAALVVGSVAALGTAAPAFAVTTATAPHFSLTSGVNELTSTTPQVADQVVGPAVDAVGETVGAVQEDGTVGKPADGATGVARKAGPLMGGLPLGG
ncbi:hypothetical protein OG596_06315 [Streptomyces sp. NBC_01102]|uniref:hypothetical protein n=1 Tax=unclassified Streptomyces TaxID=2593676 RepID=UPI003866F01D|nr:hypothetical protein OG596_06315 [Streptomyces sp. NBC_01102]